MVSCMIPPGGARAFLVRAGWADASISPLAGDASFRRYFRVADGARRAVLMDAPPPHENPRPFLAMADYLSGHGLRAPAIMASDLDQGLVLLEDFGDRLMRPWLEASPHAEEQVYAHAIAELVRLGTCPPAAVPPYAAVEYMREVRLLTEYYCPAAGISVDNAIYDALWLRLLAPLLEDDFRRVTVLRDYHAENIMLLDDGSLGLLDFQDALVGHPAYDLVSLLQDARRDVAPALERRMIDLFRARTATDDDFELAYHLLGAQRNTKIIGIFTRLWRRDGKARYLDYLPRVWRLLERDLAFPGLEPLRDWFDSNIPAVTRSRTLAGATDGQPV